MFGFPFLRFLYSPPLLPGNGGAYYIAPDLLYLNIAPRLQQDYGKFNKVIRARKVFLAPNPVRVGWRDPLGDFQPVRFLLTHLMAWDGTTCPLGQKPDFGWLRPWYDIESDGIRQATCYTTFNPGVAGSTPARPTMSRHEIRPSVKSEGLLLDYLRPFLNHRPGDTL